RARADEQTAEQDVHAVGRPDVVGDAGSGGDAAHADGGQHDALVVREVGGVGVGVEVDDRLVAQSGGDRVVGEAGQLLGRTVEAAVPHDVGRVARQVGQLVDRTGAGGAVGRREDHADPCLVERLQVVQPLLVRDRRRVVEDDHVVGGEVVHDLPTDRGRRDLCCGEEVGHAARVVPDHGDVRGTHQDEVHLADGAGRHGDISDALGDEAVGGRGDR